MSTDTEAVPRHGASINDVYGRMLRNAGVQGRFVRRPSGCRVHVVEAGDGSPVVHLHGTNTSALSHLMLVGQAPHSYLVDRPGCGLSDPDTFHAGRFREFAVDFVGDVLDGLGLDNPILVGASGGGIWAMWFALAHPDRVRGLVILGSVPTLPGGFAPLPLRLAASRGIGDVMTRVLRPNRRMLVRMMASVGEAETIVRHPDLLDSLVAGAHDSVALRANRAELRALLTLRGFRRSMVFRYDELCRLSMPTLMIWGDRDPVVSVENARAAAAEIPDARLDVLPGGHVPQLGNPERVTALLEEFAAAV